MARSLGTFVGRAIKARKQEEFNGRELEAEVGQITAAAALAHDIGNPPFGHIGEAAIAEWFESNDSNELIKQLSDQQRSDLILFEGNAQGFRILVTLANSRAGLKLTAATLGAFTKYPTASTARKKPGYIGQKKHGFFDSERQQFEKVTSELGLTKLGVDFWQRHPLAFLVEAADDICYRVIDVEDGVKVGRIAYKEAEECLVEMLPAAVKYDANLGDQDANLGWLRAAAIGNLIDAAQQVFLDHEEEIVGGQFSMGLIDASPLAKSIHQAKSLVEERVFKWDRTIRAEISGSKMLHGLLDDLLSAAAHPNTSFARKLLSIIPNYPHDGRAYNRLLSVTDFVSGMTDSYLVETYQQVRGGAVP